MEVIPELRAEQDPALECDGEFQAKETVLWGPAFTEQLYLLRPMMPSEKWQVLYVLGARATERGM